MEQSKNPLELINGLGRWVAGGKLFGQRANTDLQGKVVLITGGSRGLGFSMAQEFARQGCKIAICARNKEQLERAAQELKKDTSEVLTYPCDVGEREQVEQLVRRVTDHFGRIDILVNNAGIIQVGPMQKMSLQDFEDAMQVNFWAHVYTTWAVLPQMRERHDGRIVNITSIGGRVSVPHMLPYSASKFAATGFSEGLRAELAREGISVTTIAPSVLRNGAHLNALFKGQQEAEYTWFAVGGTIPLLSLDGERAARQIVSAAKRREAQRTLGIQGNVMRVAHGLFPGVTANLSGFANRLILPPNVGTKELAPGRQLEQRKTSPLWKILTFGGRLAARGSNQRLSPTATPAADSSK